MTDLERRTLLHLLDGQQILMAFAIGTAREYTVEACKEWHTTSRRLRAELEDVICDEGDTAQSNQEERE